MVFEGVGDGGGGSDEGRARFERLDRSVGFRGRHLALPMEDYRALDSFSKMNDKWIERASDLGQQAIESALGQLVVNQEISITFSSPPLPGSHRRVSTPS